MGDTPHGFLFGKSFEPGKSALGTRLGLAGFENIGSKSGICIFIFFLMEITPILQKLRMKRRKIIITIHMP